MTHLFYMYFTQIQYAFYTKKWHGNIESVRIINVKHFTNFKQYGTFKSNS